MREYIIYKGGIPFVRFNKGDAETAVARHGFTWTPPRRRQATAVEQPVEPTQPDSSQEIVARDEVSTSWDLRPASDAVDVNNASLEDLESLKGVGIAIAQAIISERPHASVDELASVSGRVDWNELYSEEFIYFGEPAQQ